MVVESELAKTPYWLGWCCSRRGVWRGAQAGFIQLERDTMWWGFLLFHSGEIAGLWHAVIISVIPVTHGLSPYLFVQIVKPTSLELYELTQFGNSFLQCYLECSCYCFCYLLPTSVYSVAFRLSDYKNHGGSVQCQKSYFINRDCAL